MKSNFQFYESVHDFVTAPYNVDAKDRKDRDLDEWTGPRNHAESREYFMRGADEKELRAARELANKIDVEVHGHVGEQWVPQVYGAYPIVADYLAGDPLSMRAKQVVESDTSPVRVVLNLGVSAGMKEDTIMRRAAAAAAFVMKLSERRPVELWFSMALHNKRLGIDVGYRAKLDMPMNVSQVVAAYNRSVSRMLNLPLIECLANMGDVHAPDSRDGYGFELNGASAFNGRSRYIKEFRKYMKLSDDDIVLDAGILTDCGAIDANPVQWVKDMLAKYGEATED